MPKFGELYFHMYGYWIIKAYYFKSLAFKKYNLLKQLRYNWGISLAQLVEHATLDLGVVSSSPIISKK